MGDDMEAKGRLGRLAMVVTILVGIAGITQIGWEIFHRDSTEVADYQNHVVATCEQAHGVWIADRTGEVVRLSLADPPDTPGLTDPRQMFLIDKAALIGVLEDKLARIKVAFEQLDEHEVPSSLRDRKNVADQAFAGWVNALQQDISTVQATVQYGTNLTQLQPTVLAAVQGNNSNVDQTRLVGAMSNLAGKACDI